ncbi:hypothetical protein GW17_00050842 [Ensete ventricosum]|nr:hypothetical protein GW17_00050842 [Ensete ventricosum]
MLGQPRKHSEEHSLRRKLEPSNESEGSPIEAARRDAPVSLVGAGAHVGALARHAGPCETSSSGLPAGAVTTRSSLHLALSTWRR